MLFYSFFVFRRDAMLASPREDYFVFSVFRIWHEGPERNKEIIAIPVIL